MPWALLAAACLGMFAASSSGTTRAPFLLDMSRDLSTSLGMVANLMALTSITWGISSLFAGAGSDRWGRRPFLIGGPIGLAATLVGVALSPNYWSVALAVSAAGAFAGGFTGVIMTEASARTVDRQRGRALGWVMAGQSFSLLLGVPLAAWVGTYIGWRGVALAVGGIAVLAALGLFLTTLTPAEAPRKGPTTRPSLAGAMSGPVLRLLAMGVAERLCYGIAVVYFATFLQTTYGLTPAEVAIPLAVIALGNILGTVVGGQMADRMRNRLHVFAGAMAGSALVALALYGWTPGLVTTVALGFAYVFVNAVARPSLMAALANVPDEIRGTVLGLNVTSASFGWLGAAALGGWVMAAVGFGGFGPLSAAAAIAGAALALARPMSRG
jgi:DHA1 family inner membrane transport protein